MNKKLMSGLLFVALMNLANGQLAVAATSDTSCLTGKATIGKVAKMTCDAFKNCQGGITFNYTAPCVGTKDGVPDQTVCNSPSISGQTEPASCGAVVAKTPNGTTTTCSPNGTGNASGRCACRSDIKNCRTGLAP